MDASERILVDTGFFFALFNERDQHHASACRMEAILDFATIILPWPILYETLNTRLVRRPHRLTKFGEIARSTRTVLLDDTRYREASLSAVLGQQARTQSLSLVDAVLCNIIEDTNVPISAMLTFNKRDFLEICLHHNVDLLNSH